MADRPFWRQRLEQAWREAPIAWLAGVRRSGKTTLARSLGEGRILRGAAAASRCAYARPTRSPGT
ncbi:MAG: hypothetical protein HY906_19380 [Deltaproteobacteria bacterium]|nr:hypothetical protein [Deltaproteobacteria bacterium]